MKTITFLCNHGDFPINELLQFTLISGVRVVIRRYGIIENGVLRLMA